MESPFCFTTYQLQKTGLFLRLLDYPLTSRETLYLFWKFCYGLTGRQIAKCDSRKISKQAVNQVIQRALNKIRVFTLKNNSAYFRQEGKRIKSEYS